MPTRSSPGATACAQAGIRRLLGQRLRHWSLLLLGLSLAPAVLGAAGGRALIVDPAQSHVEISVQSTIHSFVARLGEFEAVITTAAPTGPIETAVFRFDFGAIKTGDPDRDKDMNDWQQTATFPQVVFTLTSLEPGAGGKAVAHGRLRFHGVERTVSFPVAIALSNPAATMDGDVVIDTRDYGLPVIKKYLVLKVDPVVSVHFHLQAKPAGS